VAKRAGAKSVVVAEDGEVAVSSVVIPVKTCDAICRNK